ncbi:MAG: hypothetical protein Q9167_008069, partial [Letrouitia subvulpina]
VGYVFSSKPDQRHVITNWPGLKGRKVSPKVPTVMLYNNSNDFKWGFEVEHLADRKIGAFKLFLDPDLPKPLYISAMGMQTELNRLKKTAVEVTRDFLRSLYQWTLTQIEDHHMADYLEIVAVEFVVSMPAIWPEKARLATLQVSADFTMAQEEANQFTLPQGCERCRYSRPAGSLMLNKKFEDYLKSVIDEEEFFSLRKTESFRSAMMKFNDEIKQDFVSSNKKTYFVDFPGAHLTNQPDLNLKSNRITLTGYESSGKEIA